MSLRAQNVEDAIRLSQFNGIYSARTAGLGIAFHGISDDGTAMYYNPAGLSRIIYGMDREWAVQGDGRFRIRLDKRALTALYGDYIRKDLLYQCG